MSPIALTEPTVTVTVAVELPERCDRCGADGKVRTFLPSGGDLTFCGHHANRYSGTIRSSANHVVIETGFGWRPLTARRHGHH